jgi:signal transduction histidine kinase/CheY-like chemotaxis protein
MMDAGPAWRVLVVDDDQVDRESVRRALRRGGLSVDVTEAASGADALAALAGARFDCVFLDYNLPGSDGLTLLSAIRQRGHDVPVVALTGHGDEQVAVQLMKAGAADYVPKASATPERLASSLRYAIELSRAQLQARHAEAELHASAARARFLADASAVLTQSLDVRATLEQVARLSVPILGDYCVIYLSGPAGTLGVASAHRDVSKQAATAVIAERFRPDANHPSSGIAEVMRTGRAKVMNVISAEHLDSLPSTEDEREAYRALAPASALFVPLTARTVLGAAVFCRGGDRPSFSDDDVTLAQDLAGRAAAALENARLFQEAERARQRTERLQQVTAQLSAVVTRDEVARLFTAQAREALEASSAWLAVLSDDRTELRAIASDGYDLAAIASFDRISLDAPVPAGDTVRDGEPRWFPSKRALVESYPATRRSMQRIDQEAVLVLPVRSGTEIAGVMTLGFHESRPLTPDEIALGLALARQCAQALERARLYDAERLARAEAETARRDAEEANRAKSEFLARMSHDLRTPLNAIAGYAQLIEEGIYGEPTVGQRESLARIRRAQGHLLTLINDVLSFAKLEAGQVRLRITEVAVQPTLDTLRMLIEPQVSGKGLSLQLEPAPAGIKVQADEERMTQILLNLLTNAVKFTEPGGRITISTECSATSVVIRVNDTGRGIAAERLESVFHPFVQGEGPDQERQGVGLGLAIGRELARMMHGDLTAASTVGAGSVFSLTLPIVPRSGAADDAGTHALVASQTAA